MKAGIPPGLGLSIDYTRDGYTDDGVLSPNSQTGFRYVFGRRDRNGNLLLGSPSDVLTIGVPPAKLQADYTVTSGVLTVQYPDNYFLQNYVYSLGGGANFRAILSNATNPLINDIAVGVTVSYGTSMTFNTFGVPDGTGKVDVTFFYTPNLIAQIPSEIQDEDEEYFIQLYRTSESDAFTAAPFPDFRLVKEVTLTADDILAGQIKLYDDVDPLLVGAELYTNPNTREGPLQANSAPPKAEYLALYKAYAVYANITSVQRATLNLVNPFDLSILIFKSGVAEESYKAVDATVYLPGNVNAFEGNITSLSPLVIDMGVTHSFPLGSKIQVNSTFFNGVVPGEYTVTAVGATTFTLNTTSLYFGAINAQVVSDGVSRLFNGYLCTGWAFNNLAEWTEFVTKDLVRAINGNASSFMYANYRSTFDDFPGLFTVQSKDFIDPIYVRTSAATSAPVFLQNIPYSFSSGIQFYSSNDVLPNGVYFSKIGEPEAVPIVNYLPVGSASSAIVGVFPLKDSLIILKEDGVYKIVGDVFSQMNVVPIDQTVEFMPGMTRAAGVINNTVIGFCNQGVVQVTESSVQIISRRIEDVIQPLIGRDLSSTYLFGHEADRLFYVQTSGLNPGEADITWIYNVLNQSWTSTPDVFSQLSLGVKDALFGVREDSALGKNTLWRQRKTNTRVDYCGEYVVGDILVDPSDPHSATFTITGGNIATPEIGDTILAQNIFNRITGVTPSGGDYILTFAQATAIPSGSPLEVTLYKAYESIIKMAPFHAGQVGRSKHFAQMQLHMRQQVITDLSIEFAGAYYGSSEITNWKSITVSSAGAQGWGFSPWGLFPWGLVDGSNIVAGTEPSSIIRLYVPRFAARNTFIQAVLKHKQAGQPMFIQALSYSVHGYGERVSR